jgi:AcrR family transcriptional regulator
LVTALVSEFREREIAAIERAAKAAPGPLSALAAAVTAFAARALATPRLAFALMAEPPVEPALDVARSAYRQALVSQFERLVRSAVQAGHLPDQDATLAAAALTGALSAAIVGTLARDASDHPAPARATVQALTLFALRGLGVIDARARGLVVQAALPNEA